MSLLLISVSEAATAAELIGVFRATERVIGDRF
jgi:hypothetical protein